ncbi:hypothetical protein B0H67DRAFT_685673 [Lasiosphaeris hirsuta]|uniref:Uncharacterized protein n=1 Tax=Lasiosphaeris hirsuta TaxID=260670 RepID=A0AA40A184_9PEZI|nr:hypothetical protein B0H67DRAFT_685673 [Lasiosphaeris hirsuta]
MYRHSRTRTQTAIAFIGLGKHKSLKIAGLAPNHCHRAPPLCCAGSLTFKKLRHTILAVTVCLSPSRMPQVSDKMDRGKSEGLQRNSLSSQPTESKASDGESTEMATLQQHEERLDKLTKKMMVHKARLEGGANKAQKLLEKEKDLKEREKELSKRAEDLEMREEELLDAKEAITKMEEELDQRRKKEEVLHKTLADFDLGWVRGLVEKEHMKNMQAQ